MPDIYWILDYSVDGRTFKLNHGDVKRLEDFYAGNNSHVTLFKFSPAREDEKLVTIAIGPGIPLILERHDDV